MQFHRLKPYRVEMWVMTSSEVEGGSHEVAGLHEKGIAELILLTSSPV
jgi:hypothetical protein